VTRLRVGARMSTTKRFTCGTLDFENAGPRIFDGAIEAKFPLDALLVKVEWMSVRQTAAAPRPIPDGRAYSGYNSTPPEVGRLKRMKASTFPGSEVASLRSPPI
jgi:hypothetical protein